VRAVNLIPRDQGRSGAGAGAGAAVYYVLGALGVLVVAMALYVTTGNQVNSRKGDLANATQEATTLEQQAAALKPYADFAGLSQSRTQTVASLADSRFDWERAMRELAQALPDNVWLTSLVGTVSPGVAFEGGGSGATGSLRSALQTPAIEMLGCTETQSEVSSVMARLRTMHGVQRVSLASSEKSDSSGAAGGGGAGSGDCRNGNSHFPQFQLVVFFDAPQAPAQPSQGTTPGQAVTQPTSNGTGQ
jgi:Tfp pilus assembly protein PilN